VSCSGEPRVTRETASMAWSASPDASMSRTRRRAVEPIAASSPDRCGVGAEGGRGLPHPHGEVLAAARTYGVGQRLVRPAGKDLDRHRLGVRRPDHLEVGVPDGVAQPLEGTVEDVEVAYHAALVH